MSGFTVVIIIWALYQLFISVMKKRGRQQMPGKIPDSLKLPDASSIRDVIQGISRGTWKEQLKQALENGFYQAGPLESTVPKTYEETEDYVETEGTQGNEGTQGTEGTSDYVGILGAEAYKNTEVTLGEELACNPSSLGSPYLSPTERELVQGVIWAEILGKPRARHSFRGPRT